MLIRDIKKQLQIKYSKLLYGYSDLSLQLRSGQAPSTVFPLSLLYFAGGYVETSYGGQAGQALSEIEGACQKAKRRTQQYQPSYENNR